MRNVTIFTVAAVITAAPMAFSQPAPIFTRVDSNPDGTATLTIRNDSNVSLVAFVDTEEYYSVGSDGKRYTVTALRYWDVATDITAQPVAPAHDIGILTGIRGGSQPQATLMAAVFADGSSCGDPIWVQRIMHRRQVAREGFDLAFSLLENALAESEGNVVTSAAARPVATRRVLIDTHYCSLSGRRKREFHRPAVSTRTPRRNWRNTRGDSSARLTWE